MTEHKDLILIVTFLSLIFVLVSVIVLLYNYNNNTETELNESILDKPVIDNSFYYLESNNCRAFGLIQFNATHCKVRR